MGQQHNELTRGLFSAALTAALGIPKGRGGLERFGETLQPVFDLWSRPEWAYLRAERLFAVRQTVGAVAAEFGHVAIANPANSNMIVVVTEAQIRASVLAFTVQGSIFYRGSWTSSAARATLSLQANLIRALDGRVEPSGICRTELWAGTDPAAQGGAQNIDDGTSSVVNEWVPLTMVPIVLPPDSAAIFVGGTVNTLMAFRAAGYERVALHGEL